VKARKHAAVQHPPSPTSVWTVELNEELLLWMDVSKQNEEIALFRSAHSNSSLIMFSFLRKKGMGRSANRFIPTSRNANQNQRFQLLSMSSHD
jgi:hypothetical protein